VPERSSFPRGPSAAEGLSWTQARELRDGVFEVTLSCDVDILGC
jgi:hypothetical protein